MGELHWQKGGDVIVRDYKTEIINACKEAGTYQPYFEAVIDTLADLLTMRDDAKDKFIRTGANTVVTHTNKGGAVNVVKNPALVVIMDLNAQAITYWRELGLTAKSYKMMFGDIQSSGGGFDEYISQVMGDVDG